MKKVLLIGIIIVVVIITVVALSHRPTVLPLTEKDYEDGHTGVVNPIVQYDSLEEINRLTGCDIKRYSQATEEQFSIISGEMAQYVFDDKYTVRAMKTSEDISGVYVNGTTVSQLCERDNIYSITENTFYVYWFVGDMQYSLYGEGVDLQQFTDIYNFLKLS